MRGLRTRRIPGKSVDVEVKENHDYHPLLRNTSSQILALSSSPNDSENACIQSLLSEILAGQIEAVVQILTPDWVNRTIIAWFEDNKKEERVREEAERMRKKVEQVVNSDNIPGDFKDDENDDNERSELPYVDENSDTNHKVDVAYNEDSEYQSQNCSKNLSENNLNESEKSIDDNNEYDQQNIQQQQIETSPKTNINNNIVNIDDNLPIEEGDLGVSEEQENEKVISPFDNKFNDSIGDIGINNENNENNDIGSPSLRDVLSKRNESEVYDDFERYLEMRGREGLLRLLTQVTTFKEIVAITSPSPSIFKQDASALLARAEEAVLPNDKRLIEAIKTTRIKIDTDSTINAFLPLEIEIYTNLENEFNTFETIKKAPSSSNISRPGSLQSLSSFTGKMFSTKSQSTAATSSIDESKPSIDYEPSYYERNTKVEVTDVSQNEQNNEFVNSKNLELMIAIEEDGSPGWMLFRRWNEFEKLDNALQRSFPNAGTATFPKAYLPSLKFKKSSDVCALLSAYIKTLLIDPRYSESPLVINFLKKEKTGASAKSSSKLFDLTQPSKTFTQFSKAVTDIGVNKKRLSFPGPLKINKSPNISKENVHKPKISDEKINELDDDIPDQTSHVNQAYHKDSQDSTSENVYRKNSNKIEKEENTDNDDRKLSMESEQNGNSDSQGDKENEKVENIVESPIEENKNENENENEGNDVNTPMPTTNNDMNSKSATCNINDEDLNLVLNSIFSILEEAYQLSGQQWSLRRGFFRVLERVIRTSYSQTVRMALQSIVEGVTDVKNISQILNMIKDGLWPPPQREWIKSEDNERTNEDKENAKNMARKLLVENKPRALSGAMGDNATKDAVILLHELFQDPIFCKEITTLLALDLLRVCL